MAHYAQAEADGHGLELWILRLGGQERREALQQYADLVDGSLHLVLEVLKGWWYEVKKSRLLEKERVFFCYYQQGESGWHRSQTIQPPLPLPPVSVTCVACLPLVKQKKSWAYLFIFCMAEQGSYYNQDRINFGEIDSRFLQVDPGDQGRDTSTPPYSPTYRCHTT